MTVLSPVQSAVANAASCLWIKFFADTAHVQQLIVLCDVTNVNLGAVQLFCGTVDFQDEAVATIDLPTESNNVLSPDAGLQRKVHSRRTV